MTKNAKYIKLLMEINIDIDKYELMLLLMENINKEISNAVLLRDCLTKNEFSTKLNRINKIINVLKEGKISFNELKDVLKNKKKLNLTYQTLRKYVFELSVKGVVSVDYEKNRKFDLFLCKDYMNKII